MAEHYYLYALVGADCPRKPFGPGVDSRYAVELIPCGQLAALTSRVGLDQFDPAKLQEGTADLPWLSKVAVRHNEIIDALARHWPVLPMRLGILFESRSSLIAKLAPYEADAAEFLGRLGDRQEWALKIYVDQDRAEKAILASPASPAAMGGTGVSPVLRLAARARYPYQARDSDDRQLSTGETPVPPAADAPWARKDFSRSALGAEPTAQQPGEAARGGGGIQYLAAKGLRLECRRQVEAVVRQAALTVEARLEGVTDAWHRLRPLPHVLTNRPEKMVWHGALLLRKSAVSAFLTACEQLRSELAPQGLIVEATGPWPPYHFCPSLEP